MSFPKDSFRLKGLVAVIGVLQSAQSSMVCYDALEGFAVNFGSFDALDNVHMAWFDIPFLTSISKGIFLGPSTTYLFLQLHSSCSPFSPGESTNCPRTGFLFLSSRLYVLSPLLTHPNTFARVSLGCLASMWRRCCGRTDHSNVQGIFPHSSVERSLQLGKPLQTDPLASFDGL